MHIVFTRRMRQRPRMTDDPGLRFPAAVRPSANGTTRGPATATDHQYPNCRKTLGKWSATNPAPPGPRLETEALRHGGRAYFQSEATWVALKQLILPLGQWLFIAIGKPAPVNRRQAGRRQTCLNGRGAKEEGEANGRAGGGVFSTHAASAEAVHANHA